jgi:hypothetical protein
MGMISKCVQPDHYKQTDEDKKAYSWCINHGVKIGMLASFEGFKNQHWKIRIVANNKEVISPKDYNKHDVLPKLFELYRYYYNNRNK